MVWFLLELIVLITLQTSDKRKYVPLILQEDTYNHYTVPQKWPVPQARTRTHGLVFTQTYPTLLSAKTVAFLLAQGMKSLELFEKEGIWVAVVYQSQV